jgi:hypothetical protein
MTSTPAAEPDVSEEEFELDASAEDVEVTVVETRHSVAVSHQDPEAREGHHGTELD